MTVDELVALADNLNTINKKIRDKCETIKYAEAYPPLSDSPREGRYQLATEILQIIEGAKQ